MSNGVVIVAGVYGKAQAVCTVQGEVHFMDAICDVSIWTHNAGSETRLQRCPETTTPAHVLPLLPPELQQATCYFTQAGPVDDPVFVKFLVAPPPEGNSLTGPGAKVYVVDVSQPGSGLAS